MIQQGDYGVVRISGGEHKDKLAYYDDDASNTVAIVYFGTPFQGDPIEIRRVHLTPVSDAEDKQYRDMYVDVVSPEAREALGL